MASIRKRLKKDGSPSFTVRWRDPKTRVEQDISYPTQAEAIVLQRLLDANGQSFTAAENLLTTGAMSVMSVAEVVQEHIDHLVRPASGTVRTYRSMLNLHIAPFMDSVAVKDMDVRHLALWVRQMQAKGKSAKTIANNHALIFSAMDMAVQIGYRTDNPCRSFRLPVADRAGDDVRVLSHAEYSLVLGLLPDRYKAFTQFLVVTGARFGEATAVTVADIDLASTPATVRINKAWKRNGNNEFYVGPTKTKAGRRKVPLPLAMVNLLTPLVIGRQGSELIFTSRTGGRISHSMYWRQAWRPAVDAAQGRGLGKSPGIHDLRHTCASWLIQDGVPVFSISRLLGHASILTTETIYAHLMPQALQVASDAMERSATKVTS